MDPHLHRCRAGRFTLTYAPPGRGLAGHVILTCKERSRAPISYARMGRPRNLGSNAQKALLDIV